MKKDVLDTADKIILDILQENAKTPLKDIARKVYLSTPAVSARIEKMEKEGIITGYYAQVGVTVECGGHMRVGKKICCLPRKLQLNGHTAKYQVIERYYARIWLIAVEFHLCIKCKAVDASAPAYHLPVRIGYHKPCRHRRQPACRKHVWLVELDIDRGH